MTRVLLDEDLPVRLRHHFPTEVQVETVEYRDWKGLENGDLLTAAAEVFDALVTMDDNLPGQQNLSKVRYRGDHAACAEQADGGLGAAHAGARRPSG